MAKTPQQIADEIDRQIVEADREALKAQLAFAAGNFQEYWQGYVARTKAALEQPYGDTGADADPGDRQADG